MSVANQHRERKRANITGAAGYTLVETLTALALLLMVFLPLTRIVSGLLTGTHNRDLISAIDLAEREMTLALLQRDARSLARSETIARRSYRIEREVRREGVLKTITVRVSGNPSRPPLAQFYIYQVDYGSADP